jgi:hypothetical protein
MIRERKMNDKQITIPIDPPENNGALVTTNPPNVMQLMAMTIEKFGVEGAEKAVEVLKELTKLKHDEDDRSARKIFFDELAEFQNTCPPIQRTSTAKVTTQSGSHYEYTYAKIDKIERVVKPLLMRRGFSYTWDSITDGKEIKVTCCLRHRLGHEITASATAPIPIKLGSMNEIQIPSAVRSYLKRDTLTQVLGISTADEDKDGKLPGDALSIEQAKEITELMKRSIPPDTEPKFLKWLGVSRVEDINQDDFAKAKAKLIEKAKSYL